MRPAVGVVAGAAVAAAGALMLGEYTFDGLAWPLLAGALFGLAVAEVVVFAGGRGGTSVAVASALLAAAGLLWAGWITVRHRDEPIPAMAWVAASVGALTAALRARTARRGSGSRPEP